MLPEGKGESERDGMSTHTIRKDTVCRKKRKETKQSKLTEAKKENCFVSSNPPLPSLCFQTLLSLEDYFIEEKKIMKKKQHTETQQYKHTLTHTQTHTIYIEINNKTIIFFDTSIFTTFKQSPKTCREKKTEIVLWNEKITPNSQLVERESERSRITKDKRRQEQLARWLDEKH